MTYEQITFAIKSPASIRNLPVNATTVQALPPVLKSFQAQWLTGLNEWQFSALRQLNPQIVAFSGSRKNFYRREAILRIVGW